MAPLPMPLRRPHQGVHPARAGPGHGKKTEEGGSSTRARRRRCYNMEEEEGGSLLRGVVAPWCRCGRICRREEGGHDEGGYHGCVRVEEEVPRWGGGSFVPPATGKEAAMVVAPGRMKAASPVEWDWRGLGGRQGGAKKRKGELEGKKEKWWDHSWRGIWRVFRNGDLAGRPCWS
jgi:hypothetical protein